jgi:3-methyladenine DNA glycosylase AlkD
MKQLLIDLHAQRDSAKAKVLQSFFKTGKGEYGEGDIFLGVPVPTLRALVKKYNKDISLNDSKKLLYSKIHEKRMLAVLFLVEWYEFYLKNYKKEGAKFDYYPYDIFNFYLDNIKQINNWDLVDISAPSIVGRFLYGNEADYENYFAILTNMAHSENLWERRIAIVSTFYFIRNNEFIETLKISKILLGDKHDLIQKAIGWMLREVGKRDKGVLVGFLEENLGKIPNVTLRYAVEKFSNEERLIWYARNKKV